MVPVNACSGQIPGGTQLRLPVVGQLFAQKPFKTMQAEPGGNPIARQSVSFAHGLQKVSGASGSLAAFAQ